MLLRLLRYVFGYVKIEVKGFAPERFMNLLIKNEIVIWNVEQTENGYIFFIGRKNLLNIKTYLQKTNMKINILDRVGVPYFFRRNQRRAAFAMGSLIFCAIIYVMSLFIWDIKVTGENKIVAQELLKHIEENYIPLGTLKKDVDCSKLESKLRKDFEQISWISCELKGTGLIVNIEEGSNTDISEKTNVSGDLIAKKNAVITKMITRQGTPVAKVKDKVKKGDILISGTIYIYDDNNEVIETNYIAADGDIYGKTTYKYSDHIDLNYYEKEYPDEPIKHITLFFMDYCLTPYLPKIENVNYDTYSQVRKLKIFNNFYLPVGYKIITRSPYVMKAKTRDENTAKNILNERLKKKLAEFDEKGLEILKNNVTIEMQDGKMTAKGDITVIEPIAVLRENASKAD